jgi:RHH-type proline utilization regulon transcriptional repressor/proline dehydrogenase/delta 1-pyrroline-5-carboxylate dehydrogenase
MSTIFRASGITDVNRSSGDGGSGRPAPGSSEGLPSKPEIEQRTLEIGRELFGRMRQRWAPWRLSWWHDRLTALTMDDPVVRVQLFRFIDALPSLGDTESVRRHLAEYLAEAGDRVPAWMALSLKAAPSGSVRADWLAWTARAAADVMARKFIAGATPSEALRTVMALRRRKLAFTADLLGEAVISDVEADGYQQTCLGMIEQLSGPLASAPEVALIDRDARGPLPRMNLSLKLSSLTPHFDPIHPEATLEQVTGRLRPILRAARARGAYIHVDMEQYAYKALTHQIFRSVLEEPEFRDWADVGIVAQAYLPETEQDLRDLRDWALHRGAPITIRLVKGAYWDFEVLTARRLGWPEPVYLRKWQSDACFERCSRFLLENRDTLRPAFASHNVRSVAHAIAVAEAMGLPRDAYELQTLFGMGESIQEALVARGHRVRVYTPYGAILPGMAYLVRRLLENTSNESFLEVSRGAHVRVDELLRDPEETSAMLNVTRRPKLTVPPTEPEIPAFRNEPPTDFSKPEHRAAMRRALESVSQQFGKIYRPIVAGKTIDDGLEFVDSLDPSHSSRIVGRVAMGTANLAARAVDAARAAAPAWSATAPSQPALILMRAAELMRRRRFELAAWEILECGKPWAEADGDVAEAIDFCEFYAREMIRLADPRRRDVPGESNFCEPLPRGVAVVIPPWNFPLAIPTGMTVAALVTGNTVILKPSEQAPVIAWQLASLLTDAGLPAGVLQFLPGTGEEVGQALVNHPEVDVIAFTGSRDVGLLINRQAAQTAAGQDHVKRVIAEMGGKNAIIVDDDADLDEAVVGVLQSAFGYAGQKCSACSRVIVLDRVYDAFTARIAEAARAVRLGPASDPETLVGPVIDAKARRRILEYQEIAAKEGRVIFRNDPGSLADRGYFVGPMIVADVSPDATIAREEIFGPVLAILRASNLDHALEIANASQYALTGGLYSRSPAHIDRVRRDLRVGNLYINRGITGALVDRQPFGGFRLSGIGTKAGGPDYLREFSLFRSVTENTMRRGFSPEAFPGE